MSSLAGKVAVVTGAASGIGRASAMALAEAGASVMIGDIDVAGAEATAREAGGRARRCDVASAAELADLVAAAVAAFGGVDIVFGNAGLLQTASLEDVSVAAFERHLAINLTANFVLAKVCAPVMRRRGGGSMIFTASVGGLRGTAGSAAYNASKGGLVNLTRSLADELGPDGIRVNCLCPGWVDTPFNDPFWAQAGEEARRAIAERIPLRHQATPEEVAPTVVFLASDAARYVSGHALVVDGGCFAT